MTAFEERTQLSVENVDKVIKRWEHRQSSTLFYDTGIDGNLELEVQESSSTETNDGNLPSLPQHIDFTEERDAPNPSFSTASSTV